MHSASYYGSVQPAEFESSVHDAEPGITKLTMGTRLSGSFHMVGKVDSHADSAESHTSDQRRRRSLASLFMATAATATAGVVLLTAHSATTNYTSPPPAVGLSETARMSTLQQASATMNGPEITQSPRISVSNKYMRRGESSGFSYPWLHGAQVAEPFKETTFKATWEGDAKTQEYSASSSFEWVVVRRPEEQQDSELDLASSGGLTSTIRGTGSSFMHTFNELGYHHIELGLQGTVLTKSDLWVRYVRREIRSVDDEDREALLAAFNVLLTTNDEAGVTLYGPNYKSYQRLSTEHNNFAADWECDRLHDGMGFVPGHFSIGRLMEASLQSVTPGVALPYWEYTIDVEDIIANHNGNFFQWRYIPALSNRWFGATDEDTGLISNASIFSAVNQSDNAFATYKNSYGLTRSPWNNYNSPLLTRFIGGGSALGEAPTITIDETQMSTCSVLNWTLAQSSNLVEFTELAEKQGHGPIHTYTGGWSNMPNFTSQLAAIGLSQDGSFVHEMLWGAWLENTTVSFLFAQVKSLWRYGYLSCPSTCSMDTPVTECQCTCNATEVWDDYTVRQRLFKSPITLFGNESAFGLLELLCTSNVMLGDHATSASGADPSFWALHGTVERYLQVLRLKDSFKSESWSDDEALFSSNIHPNTDHCRGHYRNDSLIFGELDGRNLTNWEYYVMTDPNQASTPYVYDNFHFHHCEKLGYHIGLTTHVGEDDDMDGRGLEEAAGK